jgi:hypothetical protein
MPSKFYCRLAIFATMLTIAPSSPSLADERLVPTAVEVGDCVAPTISIRKTPAHRTFDRQFCRQMNIDKSRSTATCEANFANQKRVAFFTDRCNSKSEYFLNLNGVEYVLKRSQGRLNRSPYLTGTFTGKGITLTVQKIRQIKKTIEDGLESGSAEVGVTLTQGKQSRKFTGILDYGF